MVAHAEGLFTDGSKVKQASGAPSSSSSSAALSVSVKDGDAESLEGAEVDAELELVNEDLREAEAAAVAKESIRGISRMSSAFSELELSSYVEKSGSQISERLSRRLI